MEKDKKERVGFYNLFSYLYIKEKGFKWQN